MLCFDPSGMRQNINAAIVFRRNSIATSAVSIHINLIHIQPYLEHALSYAVKALTLLLQLLSIVKLSNMTLVRIMLNSVSEICPRSDCSNGYRSPER